jgi:SanA protein
MNKGKFPKLKTIRPNLALGLITVALWGVVTCVWYYAYVVFVPARRSSLFLTFLVIPVPFLVHRALLRFGKTRLFTFAIRPVAILLVLATIVLLLARLALTVYAQPRLFDLKDVPQKRIAIVFGAGLLRDGEPTPALKDRVATAADLYLVGKVEKLLMSGDNRFVNYDEPTAMRKYALGLGVPDSAIVLDFAGRRTYDTCYRARDIFGVHDAILITQQYHLPRALYICNTLGVSAVGIPADRGGGPHLYENLREIPAALDALWEVLIAHPLPVLGKPEPIFSPGSS